MLRIIRFLLSLLVFGVFVQLHAFAQYQINGTASQLSCNCYELTPNAQASAGSVWNTNQIDLNNPFDFNFQVWLGCSDAGADGIAFVLQPLNVNQGGQANSLGYGGISPSVCIEIDTYVNATAMSDPQEDHLAIMQNGNPNHGSADNLAGPVTASSTQNNIEDCAWHNIQIVWTPSVNSLTVYFDGVFRTSYTGDIITNIFGGNSNVYWGWTGSTGGESNEQRFCNSIIPDFDITSNSACVGEQIDFEDVSITSSGVISNYSWNFGDGNTATGANVSHTYNTSGTFDVTLEITTEGCTGDTIIPLTIDPSPNVDLGADLNICDGETVQLNNPNTLGSGSYQWTPATDLSNVTAPSPTTSTATNQTYTLTYTSNNGCSGTDDVQVVVNPMPIINAGTDATICENESTQLTATGGTTYSWTPAVSLDDAGIANPTATPLVTTIYTVTGTDANGCSGTDDVEVTVAAAPALDAGADEELCEGESVQLNATGVGVFSWTPSTGLSNTTVADPIAEPTTTTTYYVSLTDVNNCSSLDSLVVDVDPIPVADFADPIPVCDGNAVQFADNSTGNIAFYNWDFGDATTGTGANPTHIYPGIGSYNVVLTVVSSNGCSSTANGTAQVVDGPIPDFTVTNGPELCVNEELVIADNSSGPIASYDWSLGDGTTSSATIPAVSYGNPGPYTLTLTLTAPDGCLNSQSVDVQVNPLPTAAFSFSSACEGQGTTFTDQSSVATGSIAGWSWDFGDSSPINAGQNPSHQYASTGNFTVQLIAESLVGCSDTVEQTVSVNPSPDVNIAGLDGCQGNETVFQNNTLPNDNTIAQWQWQFGDAQTSTQQEPTHQYAQSGSYQVVLTATSDSGCVGMGITEIEVYPYPESMFSFSTIEGCSPLDVDFTDESTIDPAYSIGSYEWIFGDGATASNASPTHTYVLDGSFDVSLVTTTAVGGCSDTLSFNQLISVYLTPEASFTYSPSNATMIDPRIRFTNTSTNAVSYFWTFGDGNTSTLANPVNPYEEDGDYTITLLAENGVCSSTATQEIRIDPVTVIYIPNSFTPNGDGLNDTFIPKGVGIERFSMGIYNRWGEELYYTNTINEPWRGWHKGRELPNDVYVYRIDILNVVGEVETYMGNVTLVR
jgi:gliding motility-associated-like protein